MNWLKRIFGKKSRNEKKIKKEDYYRNLLSGGNVRVVLKSHQTENDFFDAFQMMHIMASNASWDKFNDIEEAKESLDRLNEIESKSNNFQKPEYTEEDRRIDDSQEKGIYSYPVGISEEREIHQSWIDDSYNSPSDSTSYDSSSSYDDSSTSSGDW